MPANNIFKWSEYKAQFHQVLVQDITIKYPFFWQVYIKNNKLYKGFIVKESDRQNLLHNNSEHPISLKNSIHAAWIHTVKF